MSKVDDLIIQAVDNRFKVLANQLKFDRTYYGKVVNIDGRHAIVNINGIEYRAQIKDGMFIVTNDVVVLKAPNGNFSFLYVDGKLGEVANADVKNQIGDLSTLTTTVKDNLVNSINEVDNEINVLSNEKMDKNKDNITEKGLTIDNWLTIDGDTGGKSNFLCNLYNDNDGNYRYVNSHGGGSGAGFITSIFDRRPKFIYSTDIAATKDEIANIVEIDLATTDKTDISLLNGWVNYDGINHPLRAIRTGKVVNVIGRIKDGVFDTGTVIATLPAWGTYKFVKGIVIGLDGDGNKVFEINVNTDGRITCQGKWASAQYGYIFNFSVDLI